MGVSFCLCYFLLPQSAIQIMADFYCHEDFDEVELHSWLHKFFRYYGYDPSDPIASSVETLVRNASPSDSLDPVLLASNYLSYMIKFIRTDGDGQFFTFLFTKLVAFSDLCVLSFGQCVCLFILAMGKVIDFKVQVEVLESLQLILAYLHSQPHAIRLLDLRHCMVAAIHVGVDTTLITSDLSIINLFLTSSAGQPIRPLSAFTLAIAKSLCVEPQDIKDLCARMGKMDRAKCKFTLSHTQSCQAPRDNWSSPVTVDPDPSQCNSTLSRCTSDTTSTT
jgi:hypothetical protein